MYNYHIEYQKCTACMHRKTRSMQVYTAWVPHQSLPCYYCKSRPSPLTICCPRHQPDYQSVSLSEYWIPSNVKQIWGRGTAHHSSTAWLSVTVCLDCLHTFSESVPHTLRSLHTNHKKTHTQFVQCYTYHTQYIHKCVVKCLRILFLYSEHTNTQ